MIEPIHWHTGTFTITFPPGTHGEKLISPMLRIPRPIGPVHLVLRDPRDRIRTLHSESGLHQSLKTWMLSTPPAPQTTYATNPESYIRWEYLCIDLAKLGTPARFPSIPTPQEMICMGTSIFINHLYKEELRLGDYI